MTCVCFGVILYVFVCEESSLKTSLFHPSEGVPQRHPHQVLLLPPYWKLFPKARPREGTISKVLLKEVEVEDGFRLAHLYS